MRLCSTQAWYSLRALGRPGEVLGVRSPVWRVAAEVAADGGGSNVERVCGFLEGVTLVDHGVDDAFSQVGRVRHASGMRHDHSVRSPL